MDKLKYIKEQLNLLAIPYEFGEWTSDVTYPYYVGEITEDPSMTEDGAEESTLILTGFNRGNLIDLMVGKEKIKRHFHPIHGLRGDTSGGAIAVFYDGFFAISTGEAQLKKIQINLKIKQWKGDL